MKLFMLIAILLTGIAAPAQSQTRTPVYFNFSGEDSVGIRFRYQITQALARSSTLRAADTKDSSVFVIELVTLGDTSGYNNQTVYAATYLLSPFDDGLPSYLTSKVGRCGVDRLAACAETTIAEIDEWRQLMLEALSKVSAD